jgi:probable FeS assembly SUF system protein SufT
MVKVFSTIPARIKARSEVCAKRHRGFDKEAGTLDFPFMSTDSPVTILTRDVEAIQIPSGLTKKLTKGTPVIITQSLGGTYTVVVEHSAGLFRILASDSDALNKVHIDPAVNGNGTAPRTTGPLHEDEIWAQLKTCYDPEIPVNIVDLGLIYSLEIKPQEGGGNLVEVKMTLTAPGCGMGPSIASDAQRKILTIPGVTDAQVDVVWDPPWSAERISQDGKQKLGMV